MHTLRISATKPGNVEAEYSSVGNIQSKGRRQKESVVHAGSGR